jgi:predicted dithiol-disulfide oxidoreductase (DUF899 family)
MVPMWPNNADPEYIAARFELAKAERALSDQVERVAAARRAMPAGALLDEYVFAEGPRDLGLDGPVRGTSLLELFGEHDLLFVYHLMYHPDEDSACPMCSLWVDGFHGIAHHLAQRMGFAVIGKAPLPKLRSWALRRGWDGLRILSSGDTTFNADVNAERPGGAQRPMVSVFTRDAGRVRHFYSLPADFLDDSERGFDPLSPLWNVLDLLPQGRGDSYPDNTYPGRSRG